MKLCGNVSIPQCHKFCKIFLKIPRKVRKSTYSARLHAPSRGGGSRGWATHSQFPPPKKRLHFRATYSIIYACLSCNTAVRNAERTSKNLSKTMRKRFFAPSAGKRPCAATRERSIPRRANRSRSARANAANARAAVEEIMRCGACPRLSRSSWKGGNARVFVFHNFSAKNPRNNFKIA